MFVLGLALASLQTGCTLLGLGTKAPPVIGAWQYTMTSASQGNFNGVLTLQEHEDDGYTGHLTAVEANIDAALTVHSLDVDGSAFRLHAAVEQYEFTMSGTVDGDAMTGTNDVVGVGVFDLTATRMAAP